MDAIPRRWSGPARPQAVRRPQNPGNARQRYEQYLVRAREAQPNKRPNSRRILGFSLPADDGWAGYGRGVVKRRGAASVELTTPVPHLWPPHDEGNALRLESTGWWPDQKRGGDAPRFLLR